MPISLRRRILLNPRVALGTQPVIGLAAFQTPVDAIANFNTLDLADNTNATVTLDGSFTAGSLLLGDIVPATVSTNTFPAPASNWIINPGTPGSSTLTLATSSGTPTINVVNPTGAAAQFGGTSCGRAGLQVVCPASCIHQCADRGEPRDGQNRLGGPRT